MTCNYERRIAGFLFAAMPLILPNAGSAQADSHDQEQVSKVNEFELSAKVEGLLLGSMIGDAAGGPLEFRPPTDAPGWLPRCRQWSDNRRIVAADLGRFAAAFRLASYAELRPTPNPYAHWVQDALPGTVTDDTRHKMVLLSMLRTLPSGETSQWSAADLARVYLRVHKFPAFARRSHYAELCEEGYREYCLAARWVLGQRDLTVAAPPDRIWGGVPTCSGQMTLLPLAAIYPGQPESAYLAAYSLGFFDIGPAKDINSALVAGLAEAISVPTSVTNASTADAWTRVTSAMKSADPYRYAEVPFVERPVVRWLEFAHEAAVRADKSPRRLYAILEQESDVRFYWESHFVMTLVFATIEFCEYEPLAAMQLLLDFGHDTDSAAQLLGAFVGALYGPEVFPEVLRTQVTDRLAADYDEAVSDWAKTLFEARDRVQNPGQMVFAKDNLFAWCIVPFDGENRGPKERALMLRRLGLRRMSYDWRDEQIPTFDEEISALRKHDIELTAFWLWLRTLAPGEDEHVQLVLDTLRRNEVKTQIWVSFDDGLIQEADSDKRIRIVAEALRPLVSGAKEIDCRVGLYNHGGWFGNPDNQLQVIKAIDEPHVGLVYNFHHGHDQIDHFMELLDCIKPRLLAVNLNGMRKAGPMILPLGQGDHETEMLAAIAQSGYTGPIGILDHRAEIDAEQSLRQNLSGLRKILQQLNYKSALATFSSE